MYAWGHAVVMTTENAETLFTVLERFGRYRLVSECALTRSRWHQYLLEGVEQLGLGRRRQQQYNVVSSQERESTDKEPLVPACVQSLRKTPR